MPTLSSAFRSRFFLRAPAWAVPLLAVGLGSCVEPYAPEIVQSPVRYLVVDGFINGNGRTLIKLTRTENIAATTPPPVEQGAKLFIQDDQGIRYALTEKSAGQYQSDSVVLPAGRRYQLRFTTAGSGAANYESDLVPLKVTPPIDKLGWQLNGDQVELRVSARDATGQSRYYRWNFVEIWEFNAAFLSRLEYDPAPLPGQENIKPRTTPIYTCWRTERPTNIVQTSTAALSQDAVSDYVVRSIPSRAERFKVRYSILLSQYTQTAAEFTYNELLRKNTEAVGTVNDPLPSQLTGNVHRVGNSEPVLGYVGAHTVLQQRLFINRAELPPRDDADYDTPYNGCLANIIYFCDRTGCDRPGVIALFRQPNYVPIGIEMDPGGEGIRGASAECADCRLRGSNVKPSFW